MGMNTDASPLKAPVDADCPSSVGKAVVGKGVGRGSSQEQEAPMTWTSAQQDTWPPLLVYNIATSLPEKRAQEESSGRLFSCMPTLYRPIVPPSPTPPA